MYDNNKEKVSIIVPVYNVENYLNRCVDSLLKQTYKNLEIILVDDGSSDNSVNVCEEYLRRDDRIVLYKKENGGQSSARNYGLDKMTGQFVMFVDSDDWIHEKTIEIMLIHLLKEKADIVCCGIMLTDGEKTYNSMFQNKKKIRILNNEDTMITFLKNDGTSSNVVARIYKKEIFEGERFEEGRPFEAAAISYRLLAKVSKTIFIDEAYYFYFQRPGSTMGRRDIKIRLDELKAADERYKYIKKHYKKEIAEIAFAEYVFDMVHVRQCFIRDGYNDKYIQKFIDYIQKEKKKLKYKYSKYLNNRKKVEAFFMFHVLTLFKMITKVCAKVRL